MIMESLMSTNQPTISNQMSFASLNPKNSGQGNQQKPMFKGEGPQPPTEIRQNHPLFQFFKDFPLRSLVVYVEIFSNGTNISETCYSYLEKLGAKIEKRINKKCNLVIWKDGPLKTIEKAKEYGIIVVNSLWLEDCIENFHCASFEKFAPSLPNEVDLPFISVQNNKKKRKGGDPNFETLCKDGGKNSPGKTTAQRKKKKLNNDKDFDTEKKVEIRLGCQRKLSEFFDNKQNKPGLTTQASVNLENGLNDFAFDAGKKRRLTFHDKMEGASLFEADLMQEDRFGVGNKKESSIVDAILKSSKKPLQQYDQNIMSTRLSSENTTQEQPENEPAPEAKVKNMILKYVNNEVENTNDRAKVMKQERKSLALKETSNNSRSGNRFLKERRPSTSSLSKSQDRSADNSNASFSMRKTENMMMDKVQEKNLTRVERILFKQFPKDKPEEKRQSRIIEPKARRDSLMKERSVASKSKSKMLIEEEKTKEEAGVRSKVKGMNVKKNDAKMVPKKESSLKEDSNNGEDEKASLRKSRGRSEIQPEKREENSRNQSGSKSLVNKSKIPSLAKNVVIQKYAGNAGKQNENSSSMCVESREASQVESCRRKDAKFSPAVTRSKKKAKETDTLEKSASQMSAKIDIENKIRFDSLKSDVSSNRKAKSVTIKPRENRHSTICRNLFDCGFSKPNPPAEKSADKSRISRAKSDIELSESPERSTQEEDVKISRKEAPRPANGLLCTNMSGAVLAKPKEFCEKFDFQFLEDELINVPMFEWLVYQGAQGLPTKGSQGAAQESQLPRNYRVAYAMVTGKPIVKKEWIDNSLRENKLEDFEEYKLKYQHANRKTLFQKMRFYIDKEFESFPRNIVGKKDIAPLITEAGGSIFDNVRTCDICVVKKVPKKRINVPAHVKVITIQWLIDSIIEGKLMNTQHVNYTVF